jgi:hypothetical protein
VPGNEDKMEEYDTQTVIKKVTKKFHTFNVW